MMPIAVMPVAALLLRLGQPDLLNVPFMAESGGAIFGNLPLLFAMGIAVGLSKDNAGAAALAGAVGYFILTAAAGTINSDINMSFFGGIIAGVVAGHTYNRFHATSLPAFLGFFSGKRLVPIMTGLFILVIAWIAGHVWPSIQSGIDAFGRGIAESGSIGQFIYGLLNRALIPVGLHHVLNSYFWFGLGEFTNSAGDLVNGDLHRFFAGDPDAGMFMTGFFPVMMFGLPSAAFAMYLAAPKERRSQIGGVLLSVALTAFLTGITEPLEFMFMFMAPALYAAHAVLTGISLALTNAFGMLAGFGFSAGLFDLVLNWGLATKPWQLVGLGLVYSAVYFCVFYFGIKVFNLKTPGREEEDVTEAFEADTSAAPEGMDVKSNAYKARQYVKVLGGMENLTNIDACITRLRLTLNDPSIAEESVMKALGASGMIRVGEKNLQIILGPMAEIIAGEMKQISAAEDLSAIQVPGKATQAAPVVKAAVKPVVAQPADIKQLARDYVNMLGGRNNLIQIDACVTRLRLQVKDASSIKDEDAKALGAMGVARVGTHHLQIVIGTHAELVAEQMKLVPEDMEEGTAV
ncbi:PTS N-acetyl-D-glucosamine transporter [Sansalvadorimonas verongulae]|nr:PTS N-acetyl-D-glucosamine transporter [Sansalvadorimonas verongulae]